MDMEPEVTEHCLSEQNNVFLEGQHTTKKSLEAYRFKEMRHSNKTQPADTAQIHHLSAF